ncbi:MAG: hypothetical protein ABL924_13385 [Methyloglobulus sp.]
MSHTPCRVWDEGSRACPERSRKERLGQPQALPVALSFCRLFGQDVLKTSFRKNSDSPPLSFFTSNDIINLP